MMIYHWGMTTTHQINTPTGTFRLHLIDRQVRIERIERSMIGSTRRTQRTNIWYAEADGGDLVITGRDAHIIPANVLTAVRNAVTR